jgi:hypothetical protein
MMTQQPEMVLEKASDIKACKAAPMTHEEFVTQDAARIFARMLQASQRDRTPVVYVLYSPRDLDRLPPCPGVYIGFNESGRCLYVGESVCVGRRIGPFGSRDELNGCKYIAYVACDDYREQMATEFYYIGLLDPVFNRQLAPSRGSPGRPVAHYDQVEWDQEKRLWALKHNYSYMTRHGRVCKGVLNVSRVKSEGARWASELTEAEEQEMIEKLIEMRRRAKDGR